MSHTTDISDIWGASDEKKPVSMSRTEMEDLFNAGVREGVRQNMMKARKWLKAQAAIPHFSQIDAMKAAGMDGPMFSAIDNGYMDYLVENFEALAEVCARIKRYESLR